MYYHEELCMPPLECHFLCWLSSIRPYVHHVCDHTLLKPYIKVRYWCTFWQMPFHWQLHGTVSGLLKPHTWIFSLEELIQIQKWMFHPWSDIHSYLKAKRHMSNTKVICNNSQYFDNPDFDKIRNEGYIMLPPPPPSPPPISPNPHLSQPRTQPPTHG